MVTTTRRTYATTLSFLDTLDMCLKILVAHMMVDIKMVVSGFRSMLCLLFVQLRALGLS